MSAENVWQQALFTVQTKFSLNSLLLRLFQHFSYNKITKQQLIIHHSQIKKVIYGFFPPLHLTPKWCICCLISQLRRIAGYIFTRLALWVVIATAQWDIIKLNLIPQRGSVIQGPYTLTTTSKPPWNQALLIFCSPWRVTRVTIIFPQSHPWSHQSPWQHRAEFPAW